MITDAVRVDASWKVNLPICDFFFKLPIKSLGAVQLEEREEAVKVNSIM